MARNVFTDPLTAATYSWVVNHSEEEAAGKTRRITRGANTAGTGLVRQQADEEPYVMKWTGTFFDPAQYAQFLRWWKLCSTQTIHLTDFTGEVYEVIITSFVPQRKKTVRNPRAFATAPLWYWTYTIEMEVISFVSGVYADSGISP